MDGDDDNPRYDDLGDSGQPTGALNEEGPTGRGTAGFNAAQYVRQLRGRGGAQDYLDVKFRLLWLRREHPDAETLTEHIRIDDTVAIFKATVSIPGGGKASGHGSETATDFPDYIEKAETKALGRALNALGYGAQFAEPEAEAREETAAPSRETQPDRPERKTAAAPPLPSRPAAVEERAPAPAAQPPTPIPARGPADRQPGSRSAPVEIGAARDRSTPPAPTPFPSSAPARQSATAGSSDQDPPLEDYSWTSFWKWAREQGYESKGGIEAFIGRPMNNLNPVEVRQLILAKRDAT